MRATMRSLVLAGVACLGGVCAASEEPAANAGERLFEQMRSLSGEWEGTFEWSGARATKGKLRATYYVTGNGSALVENLIMDGVPSMTSVYHLDGADLRMTHFCAARNQPRLKAASIDAGAGKAHFTLVDVTNAAANPAYVDAFSIRILDPDTLSLKFEFGGNSGKRATETITLKRRGAPPAGS